MSSPRLFCLVGPSGSGKSTLAKLFQALEKQKVPHEFPNAEFTIELEAGKLIDQTFITSLPNTRVFITPASRKADSTTGGRFLRCSRVASSGTTPPYSACSLIWDETTLDSTTPSRTTAALVSSQEVSRASRVTAFASGGGIS